MGMFSALDPFEGVHSRPMSLNGYSWVEGNPPNQVDPSGKQAETTIALCATNPVCATAVVVGAGVVVFGLTAALTTGLIDPDEININFWPSGGTSGVMFAQDTILTTEMQFALVGACGNLSSASPSCVMDALVAQGVGASINQYGQISISPTGGYCSNGSCSGGGGPDPTDLAGTVLGPDVQNVIDLSGILNDAICEVNNLISSITGSSSATQIQSNTDTDTDEDDNTECRSRRTGAVWNRTTSIDLLLYPKPVSILRRNFATLQTLYPDIAASDGLYSIQPTVNKNWVECIASGLIQGVQMYPPNSTINVGIRSDGTSFINNGNHRFLATVFTGIGFGVNRTSFSIANTPIRDMTWDLSPLS